MAQPGRHVSSLLCRVSFPWDGPGTDSGARAPPPGHERNFTSGGRGAGCGVVWGGIVREQRGRDHLHELCAKTRICLISPLHFRPTGGERGCGRHRVNPVLEQGHPAPVTQNRVQVACE